VASKVQVEINDEKSRTVDLERGKSFGFLGFDFRYLRSSTRSDAAALHAQAQKADGPYAGAQRGVSATLVATD
jgi:RNA-directed DNA polymerase